MTIQALGAFVGHIGADNATIGLYGIAAVLTYVMLYAAYRILAKDHDNV